MKWLRSSGSHGVGLDVNSVHIIKLQSLFSYSLDSLKCIETNGSEYWSAL